MKKVKLFYKSLLFSCLLFPFNSYSQIKGKCEDESGKEIPYVNISVKGKPIGTVSNINGHFLLKNSLINQNDSLIFSHLNFEKRILEISNIKKETKLKQKTQKLNEVIVYNKKRKYKEKIVGTKTKSGNVLLNFTSNNLGTEIGKIIKVKNNKVYDLKYIKFNIADFGYQSATFRINFYNIINGNISLTKINEIDNIVKITNKGVVKFDLSNQYLSFENNFLVAIEWIDFKNDFKTEKENKGIMFSSTFFSGPFVRRYNVNLKWQEEKGNFNFGLGIYLKVEEYNK